MPRSPSSTTPPDLREQELTRLRERVAELERALAEPERVATALRESEEQFRSLVASVPGMVYRSEACAPWRDLFVSENVFALCGYTADALTRRDGTAFGDLILVEDRAIVEDSIASSSTRGGLFDIRYRIRHADGRIRWVHDQGKVATSRDGTPLLLDGVLADITDRMQVELALRANEEQYRMLVASVPGAVYLCETGTPWKDTFMSAGVYAVTGYSPADLLRPDGITFNDLTLPEDLEAVTRQVEEAVSTGQPFELRYRIRHADGSVRWVYDRGQAAYAADGTPLFLGGVILDITEQAATERELREREERLRTIVENEPECVKLLDRDGNLLEMNPAGLWMLEADRLDQLLGRCICPLISPADEPAFREMITAVFQGETRKLVFEVIGLRSGHRILETHSVPLWDGPERRQVRALLGVTRDISARRQAERAQAESEARYRTLEATVPGAVYLCETSPPWRDTLMSDGVRAITGHEPEVFLREDGITFADITLAEDLPRVVEETRAGVQSGTSFKSRFRIRRADGTIRWVEDHGRAGYDPAGQPLFLTGVILDITEQVQADAAVRASEARLIEAQRIAQIGSWDLDLRTGNLTWSEEVYRIFELDPVAFRATTEAFLAFVHPDDRELVDRVYTEAVEQRKPYDLVHRLLLSDGRVKYVHERAKTHYDAGGKPIGSFGTVQDITARRHAEQIRQGLEAQLRRSQKLEAIGTLAGGVAHDFNNILAAVIGHAELLAQDVDPEHAGQESIRGILRAGVRARELVRQILTFSPLRGKERRLLCVEPIVLEALKLLRPTLPATIEIRTEIGSEGTQVLADSTQLHQVVVNLCTNAAHAMRERGGLLEVQCRTLLLPEPLAQAHPGRYLQLTVRDTGHGMDAATLDRVFDPFFTTKPQGEGTGLGLAVVHGIVQSHDGIVTATSVPGRGTTFQVYFPAVEGRSTAITPEEGSMRHGGGEHILVVDDEPSLVRIASRILDRLGYRVTAHTCPAEALVDFLQRPDDFDLVLSDLTMPRMTGLDLARRMLERRPDLPILLTSGYSGSLNPDELARVGIRELVGKPFMVRTIADAVARALKRD